jgi:hypothetical protein
LTRLDEVNPQFKSMNYCERIAQRAFPLAPLIVQRTLEFRLRETDPRLLWMQDIIIERFKKIRMEAAGIAPASRGMNWTKRLRRGMRGAGWVHCTDLEEVNRRTPSSPARRKHRASRRKLKITARYRPLARAGAVRFG